MQVRVLDQISQSGITDAPNEDVCGSTVRSAWVLDGATGLGGERLLTGASDAAWLARAYNARLQASGDRSGAALQDFFADLIADVSLEFDRRRLRPPAQSFELPSAAISFVRLRASHLEVACLGDCRAIVAGRDGFVVCGSRSRVRELDGGVVKRMEAIRRQNASMTFAEIRRAVDHDLRANRNLLNTDGGYWILSIDPNAARHIETSALTVEPGTTVRGLLASDGFYRLVDTFRVFEGDSALLAAALEHRLPALLAELRNLEDADSECVAYPRLKPKDDATALLFEVESR
jgi:serine/threonine protein phosphatase PrpC